MTVPFHVNGGRRPAAHAQQHEAECRRCRHEQRRPGVGLVRAPGGRCSGVALEITPHARRRHDPDRRGQARPRPAGVRRRVAGVASEGHRRSPRCDRESAGENGSTNGASAVEADRRSSTGHHATRKSAATDADGRSGTTRRRRHAHRRRSTGWSGSGASTANPPARAARPPGARTHDPPTPSDPTSPTRSEARRRRSRTSIEDAARDDEPSADDRDADSTRRRHRRAVRPRPRSFGTAGPARRMQARASAARYARRMMRAAPHAHLHERAIGPVPRAAGDPAAADV